MRILLVSTNTASSPYPVYPLGCMVVARALERAGHSPIVFDCMKASEGDPDIDKLRLRFENVLRECDPGFVGISVRNIDNVNVVEEETFLEIPRMVVETCKRVRPDVPTILGGSGFSIMPREMLDSIGADFGVVGEGEAAVVEFASRMEMGGFDPGAAPGKRVLRSAPPLSGDSILGAAYDRGLAEFYNKAGCVMPVQTKRGCSNKCVYCTYPLLEGREWRCRPPGEVIADMRFLRDERGADMIFFTDSVFNDDAGNYLELVEALEKEALDIPWTAFFQPSGALDAELVARLISVGLQSVELGPDATSDATLKAMGKKFDFDEVVRCNELFAAENVAVANYFMMGGPRETRETAVEGVENIRRLDMSVSFVFLGVRILPGTPLSRLAVDEGVIQVGAPMLDPVYYFSPLLDRSWLEEFLDSTLSKIKHCVYPPNSMDAGIRILRQMGYRGNLWEMMVKGSRRLPKRA